MTLMNDFRRAEARLLGLSDDDRRMVRTICEEIRRREDVLLHRSRLKISRCLTVCKGLCCRNVDLSAVIGEWDFVYILALNGELSGDIRACLKNESPIFASDCIFLKDGAGPCIFPDNLRPEVCLTSFCDNENFLRKEIGAVKRGFNRLHWFFLRKKIMDSFAAISTFFRK